MTTTSPSRCARPEFDVERIWADLCIMSDPPFQPYSVLVNGEPITRKATPMLRHRHLSDPCDQPPVEFDVAEGLDQESAFALAKWLSRHDVEPVVRQDAQRWRVRLTIFSGPDFRTPNVNRGAIYVDYTHAEEVFLKHRLALGLLGIPTRWSRRSEAGEREEGRHDDPDGLLPDRGEYMGYPVIR